MALDIHPYKTGMLIGDPGENLLHARGRKETSFVPEMRVGSIVLEPAWLKKRGVPCLLEFPDDVVDPRLEGPQRAFAAFVVGHVGSSQD